MFMLRVFRAPTAGKLFVVGFWMTLPGYIWLYLDGSAGFSDRWVEFYNTVPMLWWPMVAGGLFWFSALFVFLVAMMMLPFRLLGFLGGHGHRTTLQQHPLSGLSAVFKFLLFDEVYQLKIEPVVSDVLKQYFDALHRGEKRKADFTITVGYLMVVNAFLVWTLDSCGELVRKVISFVK
jgi:hypothetical protein